MIELKGLRIEVPGFSVQDVDLTVEKGEFFTLLGPTGAGKTLILEAISGLAPVSKGRIILEGRDVTRLSPEDRGIGIVYQDYALFPHLSVMENITYGLRYHRQDPDRSRKRVQDLMAQTGVEPLAHRSIQNLSGGEKQRVALVRSLAVNPSVLLLDEPLSALDPNFREEVREVVKGLHEELEITCLMVTHDFAEALFLGERTAILNEGRLEQVGPVEEVFARPATPFAARFVGVKNVFPAVFEGGRAVVHDLRLDLETAPEPGKGHVAIRGEDIGLRREEISYDRANIFPGRIMGAADRGNGYEISVKTGKVIFKAMVERGKLFDMGLQKRKKVWIHLPPPAIRVL